jgi:hypothetical protein
MPYWVTPRTLKVRWAKLSIPQICVVTDLDLVERKARLARNASMFARTAGNRITIPDAYSPEHIIREGRDAGFEADRHSAPGTG